MPARSPTGSKRTLRSDLQKSTSVLLPGMKQGNQAASKRILALDLVVFVIVASLAGEGQVEQNRRTTSAARADRLHGKGLHGKTLRTAAILTAMGGALHEPQTVVPTQRFTHETGPPKPRSCMTCARGDCRSCARVATACIRSASHCSNWSPSARSSACSCGVRASRCRLSISSW